MARRVAKTTSCVLGPFHGGSDATALLQCSLCSSLASKHQDQLLRLRRGRPLVLHQVRTLCMPCGRRRVAVGIKAAGTRRQKSTVVTSSAVGSNVLRRTRGFIMPLAHCSQHVSLTPPLRLSCSRVRCAHESKGLWPARRQCPAYPLHQVPASISHPTLPVAYLKLDDPSALPFSSPTGDRNDVATSLIRERES